MMLTVFHSKDYRILHKQHKILNHTYNVPPPLSSKQPCCLALWHFPLSNFPTSGKQNSPWVTLGMGSWNCRFVCLGL